MPDFLLRVNGDDYAGWKSVRVNRGIEALCSSFELSVSDRWAGQSSSWPIQVEDGCALLFGDERVVQGYVDKGSISFGPEEHSLSVTGRDKAAALVDCSADLGKWEFNNLALLELAQKLAKPFGVSVSLQEGLTPPKPSERFAIEIETCFEALERACRAAGVLAISDGKGGIVLTRAGSSRTKTALVEGENILSASADFDATGRFRTYRVLGQHRGGDDFFGDSAASIKGMAEDNGVGRGERSLIVRADGSATVAQAKKRAEWEAIVRAGRAQSVSVTVQGWTDGAGSDARLWPVNALVKVKSPLLGINSDMLISEAAYSLGDDGTTTQLSLKRPDAFVPVPAVAQKGSGRWEELRGVQVNLDALSKLLRPLQTRVLNLVARAVVKAVTDSGDLQVLQLGVLDGEVRDVVERFQEYGFTSRPFSGAEAVVLFVGGRRDHGIVVAVDDRRHRLAGLAEGDSAIYRSTGEKVQCKDGEVVAKAEAVRLGDDAANQALALAQETHDEIDAVRSTVASLVSNFNSHKHQYIPGTLTPVLTTPDPAFIPASAPSSVGSVSSTVVTASG